HALANAIAEAYFLEHRQVDDDAVLADIAGRFGYSRDEALQVMHDPDALGTTHDLALAAARQGISGVPFFVFDKRLAMSGCQPPEMFDRALEQALAEPAPQQK